MSSTVRFVLGAALAVFLVGVFGAIAAAWPFLQSMHVGFFEALGALVGIR